MWELDYKAEHWRTDAFELWCWRRLLRVPWTVVSPKGNQSWIFIGRTDAETEAPILWPPDTKNWLILKRPWCWARLKAGGEGDNRGWDGWMASLTQWTWVWASSGSWSWTGKPSVLQSMGSQRVEHDWATELNWTERWLYMWDSKRDTDIKNRLLDSVGEGEGGMIWENSIETCVLPYVK